MSDTKYMQTMQAMGATWALKRLTYGLKKRSGWLQNRMPDREWVDCDEYQFDDFRPVTFERTRDALRDANRILGGEIAYFSWHWKQAGFPPKWFSDPFARTDNPDQSSQHWSTISDDADSDIKTIWEPSRFGFVFPLAEAYKATGEEKYAEGVWGAIEDWRDKNQPNCGPNWMCGQEASIRIIAWVYALGLIRDSASSTDDRLGMLAQMIGVSAERIEANVSYALSQKNNHGISEANGLFTAGIVLGQRRWCDKGKELLEKQAFELIYPDGSFSQHSVNYHRVMLDNYRWAFGLGSANGVEFGASVRSRVGVALEWQDALVDDETGHAPNMGHNDGSLILPSAHSDYRDYNVDSKKGGGKPESCRYFREGGYAVFPHKQGKAVFRCPRGFRHRPSQCDLLHVDVWHKGVNVLRDAGTYSYNCDSKWMNYFPSAAAHNTVQFDDHDQMPKLSRFLYGRWPMLDVKADLYGGAQFVEAGYTDWKGCRHERRLEVTGTGYLVTDRLSAFKEKAVLRWRVAPELKWELEGNVLKAYGVTLSVIAQDNVSPVMSTGWESLYYMEKTELPVMEIELLKPQTVKTEIVLQ